MNSTLERVRKAQTERRETLHKGEPWPQARESISKEHVLKGDTPGHPFRGNQYTEGQGGGGYVSEGKRFATQSEAEAHAKTHLPNVVAVEQYDPSKHGVLPPPGGGAAAQLHNDAIRATAARLGIPDAKTGVPPVTGTGKLRVRPIGSNKTEVELPSGHTVLFSYQTPVAAHVPGTDGDEHVALREHLLAGLEVLDRREFDEPVEHARGDAAEQHVPREQRSKGFGRVAGHGGKSLATMARALGGASSF